MLPSHWNRSIKKSRDCFPLCHALERLLAFIQLLLRSFQCVIASSGSNKAMKTRNSFCCYGRGSTVATKAFLSTFYNVLDDVSRFLFFASWRISCNLRMRKYSSNWKTALEESLILLQRLDLKSPFPLLGRERRKNHVCFSLQDGGGLRRLFAVLMGDLP